MGLFEAGARQKHRRRVQRELKGNAAWKVEAQGKWICPFCASPAVSVPEGDREGLARGVFNHLDGDCEAFGPSAKERPIVELKRVATLRELRRHVRQQLVSNPAWQLIDFARRWYCAYCGDPTDVRVPKGGKMTGETLQTIIDHVESCYAYERGKGREKPFAHLKATVKYQNQSRKLAENVRRRLEGDPAWRRKDPKSRWICPYCLVAQGHIDLSSNLLMFENAPALIASHLAAACDAFRAGAKPQPLNTASRPSGQSPIAKPDEDDLSREDIFADSTRLGDLRRQGDPSAEGRLMKSDEVPRRRPTERISEVASERWGSVRDPGATPSGRYSSTLWGRDGMAVQKRREGTKGTTLRQLEESGEYLLINDPDLRDLAKAGGGAKQADPDADAGADAGADASADTGSDSGSGSSRTKSVASWRREIEEELRSVRSSMAPILGRSGEHSLSGSGDGDRDLDDALVRSLASRGLELRRIELAAATPRGDFVEALSLNDDRLALFAGGVSGEDSEAPLIAAMARNLLRKHAQPNRCPSEVLQRVNADIFHDLDGRSFVAVSYVLIDLVSCRARLARAGLSAPVIVNSDRPQRLTPIDCEGMVMGIDKGPIFDGSLEVRAFDLHPGDLLVLFTKGVIEARGGGRDEFGIYRMHGLCERYGAHEAAYFMDKFREYFNLHIQRRRDTDACVLALKRSCV